MDPCPVCGEPPAYRCRCPLGHKGCKNGHEWQDYESLRWQRSGQDGDVRIEPVPPTHPRLDAPE